MLDSHLGAQGPCEKQEIRMSQHFFDSSYQGQPVVILMGWDRPLQGFFLVVEFVEQDGFVYSNLEDWDLYFCGGFSSSVEYFERKLEALGLSVPAQMIREIQIDEAMNMGNRQVLYEPDGSIKKPPASTAEVVTGLLCA